MNDQGGPVIAHEKIIQDMSRVETAIETKSMRTSGLLLQGQKIWKMKYNPLERIDTASLPFETLQLLSYTSQFTAQGSQLRPK